MFPIKEEKNKQPIDDSDLGNIIEESITEESRLDKKYSKSSLYKDAWRRLVRNKLAMIGLAIVIIMALIAILAPYIAPYDPIYREKTASQEGPSAAHWFGTDILGRDIFSRVLYGTQISMLVGVVAVSISLAIGLFLGALSGFFSGVPDAIIMRIADIFFAFPYILGAIAIMTILGPGVLNIFIAIGILGWASVARLFRSSILSIKEKEYIEAARALGASNARIIMKHILPNSFAPLIVYSTMNVGTAIIVEAALSFLGLGVQPPTPSWGKMLSESLSYINTAPWLMFFPGLAILITVLGFVLLGDGLRDALDPRLKR
ncbi:MAG TPA: peptide ABC transporter permease [Actinobacteria bacterium]|nr:peptide ABC transporter permease [Actinomycetota bacterium]